MKKENKFLIPEAEIIQFHCEDIILTSDLDNTPTGESSIPDYPIGG